MSAFFAADVAAVFHRTAPPPCSLLLCPSKLNLYLSGTCRMGFGGHPTPLRMGKKHMGIAHMHGSGMGTQVWTVPAFA
eukprot:365615-Chlamydomonas_euryale.AAC.8